MGLGLRSWIGSGAQALVELLNCGIIPLKWSLPTTWARGSKNSQVAITAVEHRIPRHSRSPTSIPRTSPTSNRSENGHKPLVSRLYRASGLGSCKFHNRARTRTQHRGTRTRRFAPLGERETIGSSRSTSTLWRPSTSTRQEFVDFANRRNGFDSF